MASPGNPIIIPASGMRSLFGAVSGPIDPTYDLSWGTDGSTARPLLAPSGSATYGVTLGGSGLVNFAALANSNVAVSVDVGALGTMPANGYDPDGVVSSPFVYSGSGIATGSVSFAISGNPENVAIGQLVAGTAFVLERPFPPGTERVFTAASIKRQDLWGYLPAYDLNAKARGLNTTLIVTQADCDRLEGTWEAQRGGSLPTGMVPRQDRNDFWLGTLTAFSYRRRGPDEFEVTFTFMEFATSRW